MQGGRVKVSAIWPNQGVNFRIDCYLLEKRLVSQGTVMGAFHDWLEIDDL